MSSVSSTKWEVTVDADMLEKLLFAFELSEDHIMDFLLDKAVKDVHAQSAIDAHGILCNQLNDFAEKNVEFDERE